MNPMLEAFQYFHRLSPVAAQAINEITTVKKFSKGDHLLQIGQVDYHFHFIHKGAGRVYYLRDGIDVTDYFALDNRFIGGLESLFTKMASKKAIELLEDAVVYSVVYDQLEKLMDTYPDIERMGRKMAIYAFLEGQRRVESIRFLSAAQRYEELEKALPGISNRIPLKHIASFLGTTQVSLSRIRSGVQ